jgi:peptide/nickel transport system substrate-binding protein
MPPEDVAALPVQHRCREEPFRSAKIMETFGYSASNPLKIKVSTRNIPLFRDPAVILIDQLKKIFVEGELDVIDTSIWFAKLHRASTRSA